MTIEGWMEIEFLTSIVPIALPFMVIPMGARAVSGSEERKTLDCCSATRCPARHVIFSPWRRWRASLACVLAITWVLTYIAVPAAGRLSWGPAAWRPALVVLWVFCLLFGRIALLVSTWVRRSFLAITIPTVALVVMYVIGNLAQVSKKAEPIRVFSLFYHLGHPVKGDFPWTATLLMLAAICVIAAGGRRLVRPPRHLHVEEFRREP